MRLTNNYPATIFWRMFNKGDTVYWVGLKEGTIASGQAVDLFHPHGQFQLEIKRDDLGGASIVGPGQVFSNNEAWILDAAGTLQANQPPPIELFEDSEVSIPYGRGFQFIDQLNSVNDVTRIVKTTVTTVTDRSAGQQQESQITQNSSFEFGISGELKGVASGNVSGKIGEEISSKLNSTYSQRFSQSVTNEISTSVNCAAGMITTIVFDWSRQVVKGRAVVGGQTYPFVATIGFTLENTQIST